MVVRVKELEREVGERLQVDEILKKASAHFTQAEFDRPWRKWIASGDDHREEHGVEPMCRVLPIAPSTYHDHLAKRADPEKLSSLTIEAGHGAEARGRARFAPSISRCMARARSGGRCCAKALPSPAAPSSG